jgi:hypothetical protein
MRITTLVRFVGLIGALLVLPTFATAQDSVKCESNDGHRHYCGSYGYDQVRLDRQISGSPCIKDQTWGVDQDGLWVDRGCRAYFRIRANDEGGRRPSQDAIKCESNDGRRHYCGSYGYDQVQLDRQFSGSPCVRDQSWGVDRDGLWVDNGCRAYFSTRSSYNGGGRRDSDNGWWDPDPSDTWPPRENWHGGRWERGGACFYTDRNFGGRFFCMRGGEQRESLGSYGDDISSIRTFGGARVEVYDDRDFHGARQNLSGDVPDLRQLSVAQKPGHTWNNRISSVRVQ